MCGVCVQGWCGVCVQGWCGVFVRVCWDVCVCGGGCVCVYVWGGMCVWGCVGGGCGCGCVCQKKKQHSTVKFINHTQLYTTLNLPEVSSTGEMVRAFSFQSVQHYMIAMVRASLVPGKLYYVLAMYSRTSVPPLHVCLKPSYIWQKRYAKCVFFFCFVLF